MESKFKVGDRVRYAKEDGPWSEWQIHKGAEGVAKNVIRDLVDVQFDSTDCIYADELELVEPYDPTTAFLTRLQSLLREFDAEIRFVEDDYSPAIIFMGHKDEKTRFGEFVDGVVLYSNHGCISADSIMDYDKE